MHRPAHASLVGAALAFAAAACGSPDRASPLVDGGVTPLSDGSTDALASEPAADGNEVDASSSALLDAGNDSASAQGDAGGFSGDFCVSDGWCWQRPAPFGADLNAVWGSSSNDVWAAANGGILVHFDGKNWKLEPAGAVADLYSVWGTSSSNAWAVGAGGTIVHFDGSQWTPVASPTSKALRGLWGSSASDVRAVGDTDMRLHFDGHAWTVEPSLFTAGAPDLYAVWGSSTSDVWAVGDGYGGALLHFNGSAWTIGSSDANSGEIFSSVWGSGPSDVWVTAGVGDVDGLEHWDGGAWQTVVPPTSAQLWLPPFVTGTSATDVWFFGGQQSSAWWDGKQFNPVPALANENLVGAWMQAGGDSWAVGPAGRLAHMGATGPWTLVSGEQQGGYDSLSDVHVLSDADAWAAGRLSLLQWDGIHWTNTPAAVTTYRQEFTAIWASGPSDAWAVAWGDAPNNLQHWDGTVWTAATAHPGNSDLDDVWGSGSSDVWVVDQGGSTMHFDGKAWSIVASSSPGALNAVHGTSSSDVWSAGVGGTINHWDGTTWTGTPSGTDNDLGTIYAVAANDAWAAGASSTVLHWTGSAWTAVSPPPLRYDAGGNQTITHFAGSSSTDLWATATMGDVFHWDGAHWAKSATLGVAASSLARAPSGALFAVGGSGSIFRRSP